MIDIILSVGVLAAIFIFLALTLEDEHGILKLFLLLSAFTLLIFIPKATLDDECKPMVYNATVDGDTTIYTYQDECFQTSTSTTDQSFYDIYMKIYYVIWAYVIVFVFWKVFSNFGSIKQKVGGIFHKRR